MTGGAQAPRRFALIGGGKIGSAVVAAWESGALPGWDLAAVLVRSAPRIGQQWATDDAARFFALRPDVIVECAGPRALAEHAERALQVADVWTVSAVALADAAFHARLVQAAGRGGTRLRVLAGAIAGLDGVAAAAVDPKATLELDIDLHPGPGERTEVFNGSVREAALRFPNHVNVAVAAALAGPGLDATRIRVHHPGPGPRFNLTLHAGSAYGDLAATTRPLVREGVHPVAASIVAALRCELLPVWVG